MNLTATAVYWNNFVDAVASGSLSDILFEEVEYDKELEYLDTPWPSDSAHQYLEVAPKIVAVTGGDEHWKQIEDLINEDMTFPRELDGEISGELVAGALSPESVARYCQAFERADLSRFDAAVDEYLNQWKAMLSFAKSKQAGVYIHLG